MAGFPTETRRDLKATIGLIFKLLRDNPCAQIFINIYTPYPGTKLFDLSVRYGFEEPTCLEGWSDFDWSSANLPWLSDNQKQELNALYFLSMFIDDKYKTELNSGFLRFLAKSYSPIARYRVKNLFFRFLAEKHAMSFLKTEESSDKELERETQKVKSSLKTKNLSEEQLLEKKLRELQTKRR